MNNGTTATPPETFPILNPHLVPTNGTPDTLGITESTTWTTGIDITGQKQRRHPNSERLHKLLDELGQLHDKKQCDYGRDDDPFANVRASSGFGIEPWIGAMVRLNDKVVRLQQLAIRGELANESAFDSFKDIAVYACIAHILYEESLSNHDRARGLMQQLNVKPAIQSQDCSR